MKVVHRENKTAGAKDPTKKKMAITPVKKKAKKTVVKAAEKKEPEEALSGEEVTAE